MVISTTASVIGARPIMSVAWDEIISKYVYVFTGLHVRIEEDFIIPSGDDDIMPKTWLDSRI
jgi:hypothetical protein